MRWFYAFVACLGLAALAAFAAASLAVRPPAEAGSLTPTPTPSPTTTAIAPAVELAIDCDVNAAGVQSTCDVPLDAGSLAVDVVMTSHITPFVELLAFNFKIINHDGVRLTGSSTACQSPGFDCVPDFNQDALPALSWACGPPFPSADFTAGPPEDALLACFNSTGGPLLFANAPVSLARMIYDVTGAGGVGPALLSLDFAAAYDGGFGEIHSCRPMIAVEGACHDATINIVPASGASPTPTATPTTAAGVSPTPTSAGSGSTPSATPSSPFFLAIDCDVAAPGLQDRCVYPISVQQVRVGIVAANNSGDAADVLSNSFHVRADDTSRLVPPVGLDANLNANPDFIESGFAGVWACAPPLPDNDTGAGAPSASVSFLDCLTGGSPDNFSQGLTTIAEVTYDVAQTALPGTIDLSFEASDGGVLEEAQGEVVNCTSDPSLCLPAQIELAGPIVVPVPDGNGANTDTDAGLANLWVCLNGPCAGAGEGRLRVTMEVVGLVTGLGGYSFSTAFDPDVVASLNPCDIVFGPAGAGASRGPVDEVNGSSNADCAPDPGLPAPGSCTLTPILDGLTRFSCLTTGPSPGPDGSFELASIVIVPRTDVSADIAASAGERTVSRVELRNCGLYDTAHQPIGTFDGAGYSPYCRDIAITVRALEADLDRDCDVDLTDTQMIAARYGAGPQGLLYDARFDLEPSIRDLDVDIKDVQKVFGRGGSTCQEPIPTQPPISGG
jgi:hypothetical protein